MRKLLLFVCYSISHNVLRKALIFPQPALLRLKQQISEKIRTIQSQIITEEEAVDQVKIQLFLFLNKKEGECIIDKIIAQKSNKGKTFCHREK